MHNKTLFRPFFVTLSLSLAWSSAYADLAVINGNYALEAGLSPAKDALGLESAANNPYANLLVTTPALANDPRIKTLAKDLTSPQVAEFIRKTYSGSVVPVAQQP